MKNPIGPVNKMRFVVQSIRIVELTLFIHVWKTVVNATQNARMGSSVMDMQDLHKL